MIAGALRGNGNAGDAAMPIAVCFMIDNGFSRDDVSIDSYFLALLIVAIVLVQPALPALFRILDRRARDSRFAPGGLCAYHAAQPCIFEVTRTGEVLSRLTADTT